MYLKWAGEQISDDRPAVFVERCISVTTQVGWLRKGTEEGHEWKDGKKDEMDKNISEGNGDGLEGKSPCDYVRNVTTVARRQGGD